MADVLEVGLVIPTKGTEIVKNVCQTRLANAQRRLVNEVREQAPSLAADVKDCLRSFTQSNDIQSRVMPEISENLRQLVASEVELNSTREREAVANGIANMKFNAAFGDVAHGVGIDIGRMGDSAETVARNTEEALENVKKIAGYAERVTREIEGIHVIGKSLVDRIDYYGRFMQMSAASFAYQAQQAIQVLINISEHMGDHNSILVSGSGGPDGFARTVYDFVKMRINDSEGENHRFFVYHPDTNWYPAFHRLIRQNPLPITFCAKSDHLDKLCQYMQSIREALKEESEAGKDVVFHLLIPAWKKFSIKEPLHFPDDLQPLYVEGQKHDCKPLIAFNLPAAPRDLLNGVDNVLDANGWNTTVKIAGGITGMVGAGWGVNGACLALGLGLGTVTGVGLVLAVPVWVGSAMVTMQPAGDAIQGAVHDALCEEPPRILGSNVRLDIPRKC